MLALGGSPAAVTQKLGVNPKEVASALGTDADFAAEAAAVRRALDENVAAALYRSAMEGSVTAQTAYLKQRSAAAGEDDDASRDPLLADLERLSDEELIALAAAFGIDLTCLEADTE